jgi:hypothetical protein
MTRQSEVYQVFEKESLTLARAKEVLAQSAPQMSNEPMFAEYELLTKSYAQLLGDLKLLTSVSDRLQAKVDKAKQQTTRKETELEQGLAQLEREKTGRRALALVMGLSAIFFVVSEWVLDPQLQQHPELLGGHGAAVVKLLVALALYPLSRMLENNLRKPAVKK